MIHAAPQSEIPCNSLDRGVPGSQEGARPRPKEGPPEEGLDRCRARCHHEGHPASIPLFLASPLRGRAPSRRHRSPCRVLVLRNDSMVLRSEVLRVDPGRGRGFQGDPVRRGPPAQGGRPGLRAVITVPSARTNAQISIPGVRGDASQVGPRLTSPITRTCWPMGRLSW